MIIMLKCVERVVDPVELAPKPEYSRIQSFRNPRQGVPRGVSTI